MIKISIPKKIQIFSHVEDTVEGEIEVEPFTDWFNSLKDKTIKNRIRTRIDRLELGNYGDCKAIEEKLYELRLFFGSGYRIYFGEIDNIIILLLFGGDKSTQSKDIKKAKEYWRQYNE